ELEAAEVGASTPDALVEFCCSGKTETSDTNVLTILPAACLLQLSRVKLMEHVRLPLCRPKFLVHTVSKDAVVMANAACRNLVDEARNYLLLQLPAPGRPSMQGPRTRPRKSFKRTEVLYVVGGYSGRTIVSVECLDPGGANAMWKRVPSMSRGWFGSGVAVLNNLLYAICKRCGHPPFGLQYIERFDPAAMRWSGELERPSSSREVYALAALDGFLYAVGGLDDIDSVNVVERYDNERHSWIRAAPMNSRRSEHSVCASNGCLYAIGGTDESDLKSVE
ncbi:kelch repeat protein, partial [Ostertagia ostertagi]